MNRLCLPLAAIAGLLTAPLYPAGADEGEATTARDGEDATSHGSHAARRTYTWAELVELIPDLRGMTLEEPRGGESDDDDGVTAASEQRVCRREAVIGSRIKRRRCYTLQELIEQYVQSRSLQSEIMNGQMTFGILEGCRSANCI